MKFKIPKGFYKTSVIIPDFGVPITFVTKKGSKFDGVRIESSFYEEGYCYESCEDGDFSSEKVIAWKFKKG